MRKIEELGPLTQRLLSVISAAFSLLSLVAFAEAWERGLLVKLTITGLGTVFFAYCAYSWHRQARDRQAR